MINIWEPQSNADTWGKKSSKGKPLLPSVFVSPHQGGNGVSQSDDEKHD